MIHEQPPSRRGIALTRSDRMTLLIVGVGMLVVVGFLVGLLY